MELSRGYSEEQNEPKETRQPLTDEHTQKKHLQGQVEDLKEQETRWMELLKDAQEEQSEETNRSLLSVEQENMKTIDEQRSGEVERQLRLELEQTSGANDDELKCQSALSSETSTQMDAMTARMDELETLMAEAKQRRAELTEQLRISETQQREESTKTESRRQLEEAELQDAHHQLDQQLMEITTRENELKEQLQQCRDREQELLKETQRLQHKIIFMILEKSDLQTHIGLSNLLSVFVSTNVLSCDEAGRVLSEYEPKNVKVLKMKDVQKDLKDRMLSVLRQKSFNDYGNLISALVMSGHQATADEIIDVYRHRPQLVKQLSLKSGVCGVTQMDDKIFVVCGGSDTIGVFGLNNEQLEDIEVQGLKQPRDIVTCGDTRSLYVADCGLVDCVWRVSTDGRVAKFLPTTTTSSSPFSARALSLTSGRLLVTTDGDALLLYGPDGVELKRVSFTNMSALQHAMETSRCTFVLCHLLPQPQVVEFDGDDRIISVYNDEQQLTWPRHLSIDSEGRMFIVDYNKHHILLLTSDLQLDRVLLDREHNQLVQHPWRLIYVKQTHQLIVGSVGSPVAQVFAVG